MASAEVRSSSLAATGRAALVLTGAAVIVQLVGFARQLFLAATVGIDSNLDALLIGLAMPVALAGVLSGGVRVALVPAYTEAKDERGTLAARRLVGATMVWLGIACLAMAMVLWVFADAVVAITAPGLAAAGTADEAVHYLRSLAPLALVSAVSSLLTATCQAERMFPPMALAAVIGPSLTLLIMVYCWSALGLEGLVLGTLVGECVSLAILAAATIARRVAPLPSLMSRGLGLRRLGRHAAPLTAGNTILELSRVFDRAVASLLLPGGVSALRYGSSLVRIPFGAIRPAYGTAIYPRLVQASRESEHSGLGPTTGRIVRYALVFFVPLAWLTAAVAPLATAVVYGRGSFSDADLMLTAQVVAASGPLIVAWTVQPALISALNALRKGAILLAAGIITMVCSVSLNVVFGYLFGVMGIALSTSVASILSILFMGYRLTLLEPTLSPRTLWVTFFKASLAVFPSALAIGFPVWLGFIDAGFEVEVSCLIVAGASGLASYYALARRLGLNEAGSIVAFASDTLRLVRTRASSYTRSRYGTGQR